MNKTAIANYAIKNKDSFNLDYILRKDNHINKTNEKHSYNRNRKIVVNKK